MSDFDTLLAKFTEKGNASIHGALFKCFDKNGNEIYSKISGFDSLSEDALPLREDAVFKIASCTKLITTVALLQCVERGILGLDEPLTEILPELDGKEILKRGPGPEKDLIFEPSKNKITARHLLTHTSGLGYRDSSPLLLEWSASPAGRQYSGSSIVIEKYNLPLSFEPGTGWLYGCSLDWAGTVVRRLHGGISLEDYMIENIWKRVGLSSPFPTFNISPHPEYSKRLMQGAKRSPDGKLRPYQLSYGDNSKDQEGGIGLALTVKDFLAVLADLISDSPKLLSQETISIMFTPQIAVDSPAFPMMSGTQSTVESIGGPVAEGSLNHGLGGLLYRGATENGPRRDVLTWCGASSTFWFASRDLGVAGFFATQISSFGGDALEQLWDAFRKDFWPKIDSISSTK